MKSRKPIFVIHRHESKRLHWDLRLEIDGVLRSWAVPKEPPKTPNLKRLAIQVEDHAIEYAGFKGKIPEGQYGAGTVEIWDKGTFSPEKISDDKIKFELKGKKLKGNYVLIRLKKSKNWLFFKWKG
ncbi:MAG TPA: DNA polymerase ligase N-terminal domain-containing protein [archaeon]|nr:DNA polymerase ligase N-terminal domain-containing protein [archaeon]